MIAWDIVNTLGRLVLTLIVVVKITRFRGTLNAMERVSLGAMGGGSFLTIAVIWERQSSPFDGWATTLVTFGAVGFLIGRTVRDWKHDHANARANEQAERWLQARGKL
ncbi:hypothetical protein [Sphingomonas abaci]|uniref:Uncharacterized protein n=1 Tax=Sphingomonas abaci TaxID=237611 RepID=A0A7W7EZ02_9SPHN|nr:hypothetical protein [Sphingomonas abaci]MBB4616895.1 hypothetical protein [Sphingomonas abaci]